MDTIVNFTFDGNYRFENLYNIEEIGQHIRHTDENSINFEKQSNMPIYDDNKFCYS